MMTTAPRPLRIMFSAGESSGDQHAAQLYRALQARLPHLEGFGMGGKAMAEAGIELVFDATPIGVIGLFEIIKHYPDIQRAMNVLRAVLRERRPDLLILVDYKEFNYRLACYAKRLGVRVLCYVSPQVWAWRPGRVKAYAKRIDAMAVIFPFETKYYEAERLPVRYVGHPSVDKVKPRQTKKDALQNFQLDSAHPIVGLLPGSRVNEIKRLLPVMLQAAGLIQRHTPRTQFLLAQAESIDDALLQRFLGASQVTVRVVKGAPYDVIQCCDAVLTASGTATLEIALLTVPMVIVYKLAPLTYFLARYLVKTPFIGLPNIIAGHLIAEELIQDRANPENMAQAVLRLLHDAEYAAAQRQALRAVKEALGEGGASEVMADFVVDLLQQFSATVA